MTNDNADMARRVLGADYGALSKRQQGVVDAVVKRALISRDTSEEYDRVHASFGARLADRIAAFGGSWPFIITFLVVLVGWVLVNAALLGRKAFDPYPFILMNLILSLVASLQAPVILMSQNREATRDRINASHDFEVNLKAEMEIQQLHEKLDELREERWKELVEMQQRQIALLEGLRETRTTGR